jgi:hypothetical protein
MELLLAAGYFRVRIKGLSDFDKVIDVLIIIIIIHEYRFSGRRWTCLEYSSL